MLKRRWLYLSAPLALMLAWAAFAWLTHEEGRRPQAAAPAFTDWNFSPYADGQPSAAIQHNADAARAGDAARAKVQNVLQRGSLRESELDGSWGDWANGVLQPSRSLRQRFDYLLTALGEAGPAELRHWIDDEVTTQMNAGAARQVLAVWDRYVTLQQQRFKNQPDVADPSTWAAALAERSLVRQQVLGRDWAQAFYGDEEAAFTQHIEQRTKPDARPEADPQALLIRAPGANADELHAQRVRQLGADAAERLRTEDAAWADWERRLDTARARLQAIAAAPELSAVQQREQQQAHLASSFSGNELVRARAVLGIGP